MSISNRSILREVNEDRGWGCSSRWFQDSVPSAYVWSSSSRYSAHLLYIRANVSLNSATLWLTRMSLWVIRMMGVRSHSLHQPRPADETSIIDLMGAKIPRQEERTLGGRGRSCFDVQLARKPFLRHYSDQSLHFPQFQARFRGYGVPRPRTTALQSQAATGALPLMRRHPYFDAYCGYPVARRPYNYSPFWEAHLRATADTPQYSYHVEPLAASEIPMEYLSERVTKAT